MTVLFLSSYVPHRTCLPNYLRAGTFSKLKTATATNSDLVCGAEKEHKRAGVIIAGTITVINQNKSLFKSGSSHLSSLFLKAREKIHEAGTISPAGELCLPPPPSTRAPPPLLRQVSCPQTAEIAGARVACIYQTPH